MSTTDQIAHDFAAMLRAGRFEEAGSRFCAPDLTCIEPEGDVHGRQTRARRTEAARSTWKDRFGDSLIEEVCIDGPFVTADQFALFLDLMIVDPATGARRPFTEIALYTVRGGQIAEERHFHE